MEKNLKKNIYIHIVVVQSLSHVWLFVTPWTVARGASLSFTISWSLLKLPSIESVMSSNHLIFCSPFSSCPQSFPSLGLFQWISSSHQVTKVLELQLQHQPFQQIFMVDFLYNWLVWSLCYPEHSQESSPTSQFKSVNSLALSLLYGPTLTSVHDYWKNHSFD